MLSRLLATFVIWVAGVLFAIPLLIDTLTYNTYRALELSPQLTTSIQTFLTRMGDMAAASGNGYWGYNDVASMLTVQETAYAPWYFQLGVFVLCLALICGAIASTIVIWSRTEDKPRTTKAPRQAAPLGDLLRENEKREKAKRQPRLDADQYDSAERIDRMQDLLIDYQRGTLDLNTLSLADRALVLEAVQIGMENQLDRR